MAYGQWLMLCVAGLTFSITFLATVWKLAVAAGKLQIVVEHLAKIQEAQAHTLEKQASVLEAHAIALHELQITVNTARKVK